MIFLFGIAGSGKSYVGDLIAQSGPWFVYDADDDITEAMQRALSDNRPFTDSMRDEYFAQLILKIQQLSSQHPHLLITQAVYKQKHRDLLQKHFPDMDMIWIQASDTTIQQRLRQRHNGISTESAAALRHDFEIPGPNFITLHNEGNNQSLIQQLNEIYSKS